MKVNNNFDIIYLHIFLISYFLFMINSDDTMKLANIENVHNGNESSKQSSDFATTENVSQKILALWKIFIKEAERIKNTMKKINDMFAQPQHDEDHYNELVATISTIFPHLFEYNNLMDQTMMITSPIMNGDELELMDLLEKRNRINSFMPMRGRKSIMDNQLIGNIQQQQHHHFVPPIARSNYYGRFMTGIGNVQSSQPAATRL